MIDVVSTDTSVTSEPPPLPNRDLPWDLVLVIAVLLTYVPAYLAGFIWDDGIHVTANPCIVGPLGLKEIWTTSAARFFPMSLTTYWVEHRLWGLHPLPYHVVNALQHAGSALVLWRVLRYLMVPGAWLGAALWALHPVQVESVAWVAEMKNTQSCLFYLLTILYFLKSIKKTSAAPEQKSDWNYAYALIFALLAMTSKSSTVVLPLVLALCSWWAEGRWNWRGLVKVAPFFLFTIIFSVLTVIAVHSEGDSVVHVVRPWSDRLVTSGYDVWFFVGKLIWPHPLLTIYPHWDIDAGAWLSYVPLVALAFLFLILWFNPAGWSRACFFALAYFIVALLPILGFIDQNFLRYSFVADHFQYLASMGPLALAGAGLVKLAKVVIPHAVWLQASLLAALLLTLGITSWERCWVYQSQETLWTDELSKNQACWVGHLNLGAVFMARKQFDQAIKEYNEALKYNPAYAEAYYDLGLVLAKKGEVDEAITQFQNSLRIEPRYLLACENLGLAYSQKGQIDQAISLYQKAIEIDPSDPEAYFSLGVDFVQKGEVDEAITQYRKAIEISPNYLQAYNNLAILLIQKGETDEAIVCFQKVLERSPDSADAHYNLGLALNQKGRLREAAGQFKDTLLLNSNYIDARAQLDNINGILQQSSGP